MTIRDRWKDYEGPDIESLLRSGDRQTLDAIVGKHEGQLDLRGFTFGNGYFVGVDLSRVDFSQAMVSKSASERYFEFRSCDLTEAILEDIKTRIYLRFCNATKARFSRSILKGNYFHGSDLTQSRMSKANLDGAKFGEMTVADVDLRAARLRKAEFVKCRFVRVVLDGADLTGAYEEDMAWEACSFRDARIEGSNLLGGSIDALVESEISGVVKRAIRNLSVDHARLADVLRPSLSKPDPASAVQEILATLSEEESVVVEAALNRASGNVGVKN